MKPPSRLTQKYGPPIRRGEGWAEWHCPRCPRGQSKALLKWKASYPGAKCWGCGLWVPSSKKLSGGSSRAADLSPAEYRRGLQEAARRALDRWMVQSMGTPQGTYLKGRGMTDAEILQYTVFDPSYPDFVIFPLREDGKTISWQGRRVDDGEPKSVSARTVDGWTATTDCVWGLDRIQPQEPVYICEGIFDALYFKTGVAILGSYLQREQARKILDRLDPLSNRVVCVCPDADNETWTTYYVNQCAQPGWTGRIRELDRSLDYIERIILPTGVNDFGELLEQGGRHGDQGTK